MIAESTRGIKIHGETKKKISENLFDLIHKTGFEKIEGMLKIMHLIATTQERSFIINSEVEESETDHSDRLIDVISFIKNNIHNPISLKQVAQIACMTEQSFCRFFRNRMKKSFSEYLVDQRIAYACRLLIQTDKSISEISYLSGYSSSSHFCKVFKTLVNQSPYQYKRNIKRVTP
jgi:AraC-like DNA-binding protein